MTVSRTACASATAAVLTGMDASNTSATDAGIGSASGAASIALKEIAAGGNGNVMMALVSPVKDFFQTLPRPVSRPRTSAVGWAAGTSPTPGSKHVASAKSATSVTAAMALASLVASRLGLVTVLTAAAVAAAIGHNCGTATAAVAEAAGGKLI